MVLWRLVAPAMLEIRLEWVGGWLEKHLLRSKREGQWGGVVWQGHEEGYI